MATIAKTVDVSQGAISSLLNDRDYGIRVSEKTRERVFKVCRQLGYIPNDLRAFVRMYPERGDTCLLIASSIAGGLGGPSLARIAGAMLANVPYPAGNLVISTYDENHAYGPELERLPQPIANGTASKFIVLGAGNASLFEAIRQRGYPLVLVDNTRAITGGAAILADYAAAVYLALGQFIKHGHSKIAIVGGPFGSTEPRFAQINQAAGLASKELGLSIEMQNIIQCDLSFEAGAAALDTLLVHSPAPTAIFCLSEAAACGVVSRALAKGIVIPKNLSILALSDHTGAPAASVAITTVVVSAEELAAAAVKEADRQARTGIPVETQRITIGATLCERGSCGPR